MHRPQETEDLVQEVYVRLLKIDDGDFVENPKAYILQTAAHVFHDYYAKSRRSQRHIVVDSETLERVAETLPESADRDPAHRLSTETQLSAVLAQLKPIHAAVILMYYREGYSYEEMAQRLTLSSRQVKRYLANAKQELMAMDWKWD